MRTLVLILLVALAGCSAVPARERARALDAAATCDACAQPTGPERAGARWRDGRVSCEACRQAAVHTTSVAREVLVEAAGHLHEQLGLRLDLERVGLELVDRPTLMKRADDLAHPTLRALTEITERIRSDVVVQRRHRIFVLWGLPRTALLGILAHELFHVWQTTQGGTRPGAEAAFREGAANYAQYRVLNAIGAQRWARQLHDDPDPVYGKGLRRFLRLVEVEGERAALRHATRRDRFPSGY